ncbi:uncharacterized protein LOC133200964 [Saccostrea echinata]|uniref:uncharacterized protein LOC133200964 n=1 Tax=Saccostrea echinata TaxID=191078 RepID=UPI002A82927A|nr:uncharacterized protein LOC133200964 [Saccostrea echinata]
MNILVKQFILFGLFVTASCYNCTNDGQCSGKVSCPSGQMVACSRRQCTCKVGTWCLFDRNCRDDCYPNQIYDCRFLRCYCH